MRPWPLDDPLKDLITEYEQPLELSGTGEIRDGNVHIHVVLGSEGNQTISGHLHWARVKTFSSAPAASLRRHPPSRVLALLGWQRHYDATHATLTA